MDAFETGSGGEATGRSSDGLAGLRALDLGRLRPEQKLTLPREVLTTGVLVVFLALPVMSPTWAERPWFVLFWIAWAVVAAVEWLLVRPRQGYWTGAPRRARGWLVVASAIVLLALWIVCAVVIARWAQPPRFAGADTYDAGYSAAAGAAGCFIMGATLWPSRWRLSGVALALSFFALFALFGGYMAGPLVVSGLIFGALGVRGLARLAHTLPRALPPRAGRDWDPASAADWIATRPDAFRDVMASLFLVGTADDVYLARKTRLSWPDLYRHLYWLEAWGYLVANSGYRRGRLRVSGIRLTGWGRGEFAASLTQAGAAAA